VVRLGRRRGLPIPGGRRDGVLSVAKAGARIYLSRMWGHGLENMMRTVDSSGW
jgi:hypothetical protein